MCLCDKSLRKSSGYVITQCQMGMKSLAWSHTLTQTTPAHMYTYARIHSSTVQYMDTITHTHTWDK